MSDLLIYGQPGSVSVSAPAPTPAPAPAPTPSNWIVGTDGNDVLVGTAGNDIISGVLSTTVNLGRGTVDRLTGGAGSDIFVLADARGNFYSVNRDDNWGTLDHAFITDFEAGDRIQVAPGNYLFRAPSASQSYWSLWLDRDNDGRITVVDEQVARITGTKAPTLADLVYVGQPGSVSVVGGDAAGASSAPRDMSFDLAGVFGGPSDADALPVNLWQDARSFEQLNALRLGQFTDIAIA
jgi:hypothetical protein